MAVKSHSPDPTRNMNPSLFSTILENSPSGESRKRGHSKEILSGTNEQDEEESSALDLPEAKKQHSSPAAAAPVVSKRPPFPFAVPRALARTAKSNGHTRTSSSTLNPFASEFVFRPPVSAPKLESVPKEFSPVHLQQSSKSLFNVLAPEFNPSKPPANSSSGSVFPSSKGTLFPAATLQLKPPTIFIKPSPTKKILPIKKPGDATPNDDVETPADDFSEEDIPSPPTVSDTHADTISPEPSNVPSIAVTNPAGKQSIQEDESTETLSDSFSDAPLPLKKLRQTRSATPTPIRRAFKSQLRKTTSDDSPEREFNGYPAFWEQRLLKSEQKAERDRPLSAKGSIAKSLADELFGSDDSVADKENREKGYGSGYSDEETKEDKMRKMYRFASRQSTAQLERLVANRLQPVLKGLEDLQLGIQKLSTKDKEDRSKEAASDADDEDDEIAKKPGLLGMDRIKSAVIEALRQEKELFTPPIIDRSAADKELQNLRSIIDNLKSKLLDSEDNLDREERRRADLEHRTETLSRDLIQSERELDSRSDQLRKFETDLRDLQKSHDAAQRGWDEEKHARSKLDEIIKNIRSSLGQLTDKNAKLTLEVSSLQSLSSSQKDDISSLREEVSKARGENGKLSRERIRLEREIEDERTRFSNLQNELMETGKAVADQETRWREELSAEKLRVHSLERSLADEERRVKKMEEECDKLSKIAEERGKLKAMVEATVVRERSLEIAKEALERRVYTAKVASEGRVRLEKDMTAQFDRERHALNKEIVSLKAAIETLQAEKAQEALVYEREKAAVASQTTKIESLGQEIRQVTQKGLEREAVLKATKRQLEESQAQVEALRNEISTLRQRLDSKDAKLESLHEIGEAARLEIVEKDKHIVQLEFIIASTTSPTKRARDDQTDLKLQRRDKEILRLREMMAALIRDNDDLLSQSADNVPLDFHRKYIAMKNILRAEKERRKGLEKDLARAIARDTLNKEDVGRTPGSRSVVSLFDTPSSAIRGLDTPVSLKDTPLSVRGFGGGEDTPLKGRGVLFE